MTDPIRTIRISAQGPAGPQGLPGAQGPAGTTGAQGGGLKCRGRHGLSSRGGTAGFIAPPRRAP